MPRKTSGHARARAAVEHASMRPRPDAAENPLPGSRAPRALVGFNEAAARCRGKLAEAIAQSFPPPASMRPRPDAAENLLMPCAT